MRLLTLLLLVTLSTLAFGQSTEAEKVNILHKQKFEWLISGKVDSLNALLAAEVNYVHSNGWIQNREEVLADMRSGKLQYKSVEVEDAQVSILENTATVTGRGTFSGVMNGTAFSVKLLYTEVYVKVDGRWRLAGRHACRWP